MLQKIVIFTALALLTLGKTKAQKSIELEAKVSAYLNSEDASDQYDGLAALMEFNAGISLEQAKFYSGLFQSDAYLSKDQRYPLLSDFILADVLYYNEMADSSLFHYLNLARKSTGTDQNMLAASGLGNAAYVLSDLGDKIGAINLLKQNLDISRSTGDIRDYSDHTFSIARYYVDLELRDSAIYYFEKTIDIDRKVNNKEGMVYNMHTLLEQYIASDKLDEASEMCLECIRISEDINEDRALANCYYFSALNNFKTGMLVDAKSHIQKAINIDNERKDDTRLSKYFRFLGDIDYSEKNFEKAKVDYEQAVKFAEKFQQQENIVKAQLSLSQVLRDQGQFRKSLSQIQNAETIVEKNNLNNYRIELFEDYSSLYDLMGNIEKAYAYKQKESKLLTSRLSEKTLLASAQSRSAFDLFKMENINRTLQAEKKLADAKIRRRNNLILTSGIIGCLLLGLGYFAFQFQKQKAKQEARDLEFQVLEKEMTALRSQMNPHFLFNSLSSINDYIMHENPRLASKYLTKFSMLMRTILNNSREKLITLEEELKAATLYVEMENLRFSEQFRFEVNIDHEIKTDLTLIPSMLIQPYLENAIKHGLRNGNETGILDLKIQKAGDVLHIFIEDNGIGRKEAMKLKSRKDQGRKSYGLEITTGRIELLNIIHDLDAGVQIVDKKDPTGTVVMLKIKYLKKEK